MGISICYMGRIDDAVYTIEINQNPLDQHEKPISQSDLNSKRSNSMTALSHYIEAELSLPLTFSRGIRPEVLFEGMLMKYKPGLAHTFVPRWAQLTYNSFCSFKHKEASRVNYERPLTCAALTSIVDVIKLESDSQEFLFEIILKENEKSPKKDRFSGPNSTTRPEYVKGIKYSWSYRVVEWFSSEKRLLYATKDAQELDDWIESIKAGCLWKTDSY